MMSEISAPAESKSLALAPSGFLAAVWAIVQKDLILERHTKQILSVMFLYSLSVVILFNFALETNLAAAREVATGLLWATVLLAGTLGLNRSLLIERENNSLDAILMAPIERSAIYAGKVISITLFTLLMEAILIVIFIVFFNRSFWRPGVLLLFFLGTIGYVAVGVLISSMTIQTRARDVLLPVLLLPLSLPLVLPAATATARLMLPEPVWTEAQGPLALVLMYDLIMLAIGFATYHYVIEQ